MKHYLKLVQNMSGSGLVAIEPENRNILTLSISKERNILIAERFISDLAKVHGKHPVSTDGGTWYPQARRFLNLKHHIHSSYEKSIIKGQYSSISRTG
jgi:putative transposase